MATRSDRGTDGATDATAASGTADATATASAVARDDFLNAARSSVVLGVVGGFVALVALVFLAERSLFADPYRTLYDVLQAVALVGPILLAPLTYLAVVGDRTSGRLRFVMGLPASRTSYVAGKALSRLAVAALAAVGSVAVGFLVAAATFANAPAVGTFLLFAGATALYCVAFASVFVAVSASVSRRSRAMFGAIAVYFVLVPFWIGMTPPLTLETVFSVAGDLLGTEVGESTRRFVRSLSPMMAYGGLTEPVFEQGAERYERLSGFGDRSDLLVERAWFQTAVLLAWSAGSLAVGYLRFRRSELG